MENPIPLWGSGIRASSRFFSSKANTPKLYENADVQKLEVLKENKGKSGVYLWINNINGNKYVGSSVNLSRRLVRTLNIC